MAGLLTAALVGSGTALGERAANEAVVDRPVTNDLYLASDRIFVRAPVEGDLVAAARTIRVSAPVTGDAILAGDTVSVVAPVSDDVRAAGRDVRLAGSIAGHVVAAGESVTLVERVEDWAWLAGERIDVRGSVGSLRATGESVTIQGEVRGDAEVSAATTRLAPGAVVRGDLRWSGEHAPELDGGRVEGRIVEVPAAPADGGVAAVLGVLFWIASLVFAVLLLFVLIPRGSARVARTVRATTWKSLGLGLAVLAGAPLVIAAAFMTGVLWIVGLFLLALYALAWIGGALLGIVATGDLVLDLTTRDETPTRRQRAAAAALAALTVALLALVPVVGVIVLVLVAALGVGSASIALVRARRASRAEPVAAEPAPA